MGLAEYSVLPRGERTRRDILRASVDIASADGLDGLTIGRLANELQMSKSGLFAHFGSKEDLQIATLQAASDTFIAEVVVPSESLEHGLPRLTALLDAWIDSVANTCNRGGCFFYAVSRKWMIVREKYMILSLSSRANGSTL